MTGRSQSGAFMPAMGRHGWLPLYDVVARLGGANRVYRAVAVAAAPPAGGRVLDVGCGTGSLALAVRRRHPDVEVVGLDPDGQILERARRKAARAGLAVDLDQGYAQQLPYPDGSFDRVLSTLMLHHLSPDAQEAMLAEVRRVLKPGGSVVVADVAGPVGLHGLHGLLARTVLPGGHQSHGGARHDSRRGTHGGSDGGGQGAGHDQDADQIPQLLAAAGLREQVALEPVRTRLGPVGVFRAHR